MKFEKREISNGFGSAATGAFVASGFTSNKSTSEALAWCDKRIADRERARIKGMSPAELRTLTIEEQHARIKQIEAWRRMGL